MPKMPTLAVKTIYDGKAGQLELLELNGETRGVGNAGVCPSLGEMP